MNKYKLTIGIILFLLLLLAVFLFNSTQVLANSVAITIPVDIVINNGTVRLTAQGIDNTYSTLVPYSTQMILSKTYELQPQDYSMNMSVYCGSEFNTTQSILKSTMYDLFNQSSAYMECEMMKDDCINNDLAMWKEQYQNCTQQILNNEMLCNDVRRNLTAEQDSKNMWIILGSACLCLLVIFVLLIVVPLFRNKKKGSTTGKISEVFAK